MTIDNGSKKGSKEHASSVESPSLGGVTTLPAGTRLGGRYVIERAIAAGGFGITYAARHEGLGRRYAIKEHFPRDFSARDASTSGVRPTDPSTFRWALERFLREGRALADCKHPSIVDVTDVFEENGTAYMVLGFEAGSSLKHWLADLGRIPTQAELDGIAAKLLDALEYLHGKGMLHRDIAPDNIIVRPDGTPCLIDFGSARHAVVAQSKMMSAIIKSGFSPPEQYASEGRPQGPWSDIYALGATLYYAFAGRPPIDATSRLLGEPLKSISELLSGEMRSAYRQQFLHAIDRSLSVFPRERPQSIAEWRAELLGIEAPLAAEQVLESPRAVSAAAPALSEAGLDPAAVPEPSSAPDNGPPGPIEGKVGWLQTTGGLWSVVALIALLTLALLYGLVVKPQPSATASTTGPTPAKPIESNSGSALFPLYGATLGRTTVAELAKLGKLGCDKGCYVIEGMNFWFHKEKIFGSMYFVTGGKFPVAWTRLGLTFEKSYRDWLLQLENMAYRLKIEEAPHVETWNGKDSLKAVVVGSSTQGLPTEIKLDFRFSGRTGESDAGTLYSISIRARK